jgi:hypothetical protein
MRRTRRRGPDSLNEKTSQHAEGRLRSLFFFSGGDSVEPRCPYCPRTFPSWALAKRHVKFCRFGKHPRPSVAAQVARRNRRALLAAEVTRNLFDHTEMQPRR